MLSTHPPSTLSSTGYHAERASRRAQEHREAGSAAGASPASEERFRRTFENAAVGMILTDLQGRFLEYNARFCEFLGYSPEELRGRSFTEFMVPDEVAQDLEQQRRVVRGEIASFTRDKRYFRKDGAVVWGNITVSIIQRDARGRPLQIMGILQDITERKALEADRERSVEAAEAANRAKDEFLAHVSHEIRTPMNAILGMTELALDTPSSPHQHELLCTVRSAATNLLGMVDDLLDFSKIEAGKLALARDHFSLRAVLGDTLRALAVRAQRKGLELCCRVRPEVPDALDGDAGRLRQVLMNLVGNAIKFTSQGEVDVEVELGSDLGARPASEGEAVTLTFRVRDTGIGIPHDKQSAIFRAFEQADASTTRDYGGTGLGLTISAQLVALMGGDIAVESAPGCGSTFFFTAAFARSSRVEALDAEPTHAEPTHAELARAEPSLAEGPHAEPSLAEGPHAAPSLAEVARAEAARAPRPPETPGGIDDAAPSESVPALRMLIAEDNEFNLALLRELANRSGHHAEFARDGRTALGLAIEGTVDLLLLDLHMPELDGFEVLRRVRAHERVTGRRLPIIALTARSSARDRELCLAAGADDFLSKPVEAVALWSAVSRLMARRARRVRVPAGSTRRAGALVAPPSLPDRLRGAFRHSVLDLMSKIRHTLRRGDFVRLGEAAHQLVGTVGAFSTLAAEVAAALEEAALRQEPVDCAELVERVGCACEGLLGATTTLSFESLLV